MYATPVLVTPEVPMMFKLRALGKSAQIYGFAVCQDGVPKLLDPTGQKVKYQLIFHPHPLVVQAAQPVPAPAPVPASAPAGAPSEPPQKPVRSILDPDPQLLAPAPPPVIISEESVPYRSGNLISLFFKQSEWNLIQRGDISMSFQVSEPARFRLLSVDGFDVYVQIVTSAPDNPQTPPAF